MRAREKKMNDNDVTSSAAAGAARSSIACRSTKNPFVTMGSSGSCRAAGLVTSGLFLLSGTNSFGESPSLVLHPSLTRNEDRYVARRWGRGWGLVLFGQKRACFS